MPKAREILLFRIPYQGRVIETVDFTLKESGTENFAMVIKFLIFSSLSDIVLYRYKNLYDTDKKCNSYNWLNFQQLSVLLVTSQYFLILRYAYIFFLQLLSKILETLYDHISGTKRDIYKP